MILIKSLSTKQLFFSKVCPENSHQISCFSANLSWKIPQNLPFFRFLPEALKRKQRDIAASHSVGCDNFVRLFLFWL